jgi:hypothetical protein
LLSRLLFPASHECLSLNSGCPHLSALVSEEMIAWTRKVLDLRLLGLLLGALPPPCPLLFLKLALNLGHRTLEESFLS